MRPAWLCSLALACAAACSETPTAPARDAAPDDVADAPDAAPKDAALPPPWPHELPPASAMGDARGLHTARVIVHSHSVHSHDACDGNPYVDGGVNEPCLQSFRGAVCRTRVDVIFLTEHAGTLADGPFERAMQVRPGDEPVMEGGALVGYRIACADGHRTLLLPGAENELMPLGLARHPAPVNGSLGDAYHADDAAGVGRFREAGALVAVAHVEQRTIEHLRALSPDVVEVYNVHANLDPRIAPESLGVNVGPIYADLLRFTRSGPELEPDLAFLAFFRESDNDLGKWAQLWSDGRNVPGVAGSDAHENTLPALMADGERGDSYRRVLRFFSNEVLVRGDLTRESVMSALGAGRGYVAFEALGTPVGFSHTARARDGTVYEMGSTAPLSGGVEFVLRAPSMHAPLPGVPAPRVEMRLYRAEGATWQMVQRWESPDPARDLTFTPPSPGVYRAEVRMVPEHARPYLPQLERLVRDVPWVYGNPIRVAP